MPIPLTETQLVKAEIRAEMFEKAFVQLAIEFARRDRKGFEGAARSVRASLDALDLRKHLPPAHVEASTVDVKLLRESGLRDALFAYNAAVSEIGKRVGFR